MSQMYYYHLESRWRNSHILALVCHGPLQIATFWSGWPSTFHHVGLWDSKSILPASITTQDKLESVSSSLRSLPKGMIHQPIGSKCFKMCWFGSQIFLIGEIFPNSASTHIGWKIFEFWDLFFGFSRFSLTKKKHSKLSDATKNPQEMEAKKHMTFNHPSFPKKNVTFNHPLNTILLEILTTDSSVSRIWKIIPSHG